MMADTETERLTITLPPEAERHGDYHEVTVVAEDRSQATVKRNRKISGMVRLYENGRITPEQFLATVQITRTMELFGRDVSVRASSVQARVDNSSNRDNDLYEDIRRVRDEVTYRKWHHRLPMPKRMVIDMIVVDRPLAATARIYRLSWARARLALTDALDLWNQLRDDADKLIDEDDLKSLRYKILTSENERGI